MKETDWNDHRDKKEAFYYQYQMPVQDSDDYQVFFKQLLYMKKRARIVLILKMLFYQIN